MSQLRGLSKSNTGVKYCEPCGALGLQPRWRHTRSRTPANRQSAAEGNFVLSRRELDSRAASLVVLNKGRRLERPQIGVLWTWTRGTLLYAGLQVEWIAQMANETDRRRVVVGSAVT